MRASIRPDDLRPKARILPLVLLAWLFAAPVLADCMEITNRTPQSTLEDLYELDFTLPACDDPSDPSVRVIDDVTDWADINDPTYRVFCVEPGDYRAAGAISLTESGTACEPRVIRYYDPSAPVRTLHPVHMAGGVQAKLLKLQIAGADHWIIDGISIPNDDADPSLLNTTVLLNPGSDHNILSEVLIEGGRTGVQIKRSSYNTLQRSVVRNTIITSGDSNCITLRSTTEAFELRGNRVVSNESYDCTDSLHLLVQGAGVGTTFPGTIVANNDFYLTPARYTDCSGNFDPLGACAAAEGRFDLKGGGTSSDPGDLVHVTRNRIWGAKKTDDVLGGGGSWGTGLETCCSASSYVLIEKNLIIDVDRGTGSSATTRSTFRDNVFYDVHSDATGEGMAFYAAGQAVEIYRNTLISAVTPFAIVGNDNDILCNTIIDTTKKTYIGGSVTGLAMDYNAYYGTAALQAAEVGPNNIVMPGVEDAQHEDLCFQRRIITGPETYCIPNGKATAASPHADLCDSSLGSRPGIGIDDLPPPPVNPGGGVPVPSVGRLGIGALALLMGAAAFGRQRGRRLRLDATRPRA